MESNTQREYKTRVDLREAIEKEVLSYMTAIQYDKVEGKLALERKVTFTPFPNAEGTEDDPAAKSYFLLLDVDPEIASAICGQYLNSDSTEG